MQPAIASICLSKSGFSSVLDYVSATNSRLVPTNLLRVCEATILNSIVVDTLAISEMGYGNRLTLHIRISEHVLYTEEFFATAHLPSHMRSAMTQKVLVGLQNLRHARLEAKVDVP